MSVRRGRTSLLNLGVVVHDGAGVGDPVHLTGQCITLVDSFPAEQGEIVVAVSRIAHKVVSGHDNSSKSGEVIAGCIPEV